MQLNEFITFFTLRGRVIEHKKLYVPNHKHEYFQLKVQSRGYSTTIHYSMLDDVCEIVKTKLINYMAPYDIIEDASMEQIVEALLPNELS